MHPIRSRAGHTAERLAYMFNQEQWVGDDEQYAASMALMATQLGIPTRVVMGFYPASDADVGSGWQVRGTETHVWVEAFLEGAGWDKILWKTSLGNGKILSIGGFLYYSEENFHKQILKQFTQNCLDYMSGKQMESKTMYWENRKVILV